MILDNMTAVPRFGMLTREQCETIHRASLEILRRTGVRVYHDEALNLLRQTDAVLIDGNLVRFQPGLVEWALAQAPSRIPLCRRGSDEVVAPLEGRIVSFGTGSDCLTYRTPAPRSAGPSPARTWLIVSTSWMLCQRCSSACPWASRVT
jgi:trimethylamine--corrinoid protein Co-methyltransferase